MGGYGSTRWNSHTRRYTVEDGLILKVKTIHSALAAYWNGTITWSQNGEKLARIGYQVLMSNDTPSVVQLTYKWNDQDMDYLVRLNSTPLPWGGVRYWFTCPNTRCNRRVANLYMPPGNPYFACRTCHHLTYKSSQEKGQSDGLFRSMANSMQDIYPGMTAKDMAALLEDRYTDHMQEILLEQYSNYLSNLPDQYEHYLTGDELCNESGLSRENLERMSAIRLLVPNQNGKFRPKLVTWARKLAYLLRESWEPAEIKHWAKGRFETDNPKQWPPYRDDWRL